MRFHASVGNHQQVQIVVAEHAHGARPERFDEPQDFQRLRTAVHQVADKPKPVFGLAEADFCQQILQRFEAALQIADRVGCQLKAANSKQ